MTTVVLGIDGATFDLFEDWLSDLPTISAIIESGSSSPLDSCLPPVTSPAWRCYATGKNPASLGVYWWRQLHRDTNTFHGADEHPLTSKCYWEYLSEAGQDVVVMGVPLNAPPREVNGALVTGGPFANPERFTYPESLGAELRQRFDYQLHPSKYPSVDTARDPEIIDEFSAMIDQRFDAAEWLREEYDPDLLNLTLFYINTLQHKAWRCPEVKRLWEQIDRRLADFITDEDDVIIHSDHGLHEVERVFYINGWLQEQGYLVVGEPENSDLLTDKALDLGEAILSQLNLASVVGDNLPKPIESMLGVDNRRLIDSTAFETRINFERSRAVALPQGPVYVFGDEDFRSKLKRKLEAVKDPRTGKSILSEVLFAEDVYREPLPQDAPDLLVQWNDGYEVKDIHHNDPTVMFGPPQGVLADNERTGILLASGPNVASGGMSSEGSSSPLLQDLAPTLLHLHGYPVPDDMDGSVRTDLFAPDSLPANCDVTEMEGSASSSESVQEVATQNVESRLQDLGYLE